jgi:site-specific DNA-methyltransferase (adenine-specific)
MVKSEVYNMDCMEGMKQYPDKHFDLAIVDPPYGINAPNMQMGQHLTRTKDGYPSESTAAKIRKGRLNSGGGKLKNRILNTMDIDWDNTIPTPEYFTELFRVSKNQIIWGGNYFHLPPTRGIVVWDKIQPWDNFSQFELAWTSFDCPAKMFRYSNTGGANTEAKIHATQKPVALYCFLIDVFAGKDPIKILDTHLGSGSHRIAAHAKGHEFTGYERSQKHFEDQEERFQRYLKGGLKSKAKEFNQTYLFS